MTRLLTCGYETGDVNESGVTTTAGFITLAVVSAAPTPRTPGAYCLKVALTSTTNNASYKTWTMPAAKTDLWVRFSFLFHVGGGVTEYGFGWVTDSSSGGAGIQTVLTYSANDGAVRLRRGDVAGTVLATSSAVSADVWHTVDWRTQITSISAGVSEIWVDGVRVINFSGDNVQTSVASVLSVVLGIWAANPGGTAGTYVAVDDIAINDTAGSINNGQIGDGRVVLLKPNGAGSNTAQTRGGTDSGANWSQVDELPPSMTDYVYSATAATRDTYALEDLPAGSWSVNCVEALAYAQNSDAGAGSLGLTVKSGSTTNEATAQALTSTAAYYRQLYETDPATSVAWTNAAANALEAGTTVR